MSTFKVWVEVEELDDFGDPVNPYDPAVLPDPIGEYDNLEDAIIRQAIVCRAFGSISTIETSDAVKHLRALSLTRDSAPLEAKE